MMLFILSCVLIVILFIALNKRTKILILILLCLTVGLNAIFKNSAVTTNNLGDEMMGMGVIAYVFMALIAGADFISNIIKKINSKYANVFRKIFIANSFASALFVAYLFFIKGVIYD